MALPFSELLKPVFDNISAVYNLLLTSEDPAIRFVSLSVGLALYIYFVWHFYHKVAARDMAGFVPERKEKTWWGKIRQFFSKFFYVIKYLVVFPLYSFFWFAFLAVAMALLNPSQDYTNTFLISALIISTTRILAYVKESAAREIAKLLPLVFISTILLNQVTLIQPLDLEEMFAKYLIPLSIGYFRIIIPLEIVLRLVYDAKKLFFPEQVEEEPDESKYPKFAKEK